MIDRLKLGVRIEDGRVTKCHVLDKDDFVVGELPIKFARLEAEHQAPAILTVETFRFLVEGEGVR